MSILYSKEIPVRHHVDILVVGGGPAGCSAAWAAAKQGANVLLLEGHTCFGGLGTAGMVPLFMSVGDGEHLLSAGFASGLYKRLYPKMDLNTGIQSEGGSLAIKAEELKRTYEDILIEMDVPFAFQSQLIDVQTYERKIKRAIFAAKSGLFAVEAKMFVDCTGDGDLCVMAGASYKKGDENGNMQAGTLCSLWAGINWDKVEKPDNRELETAIKDNIFAIPDRSLPGMWEISSIVGGGNIGHLFGVDGTDERSLTKAFIRGRKYMREYERYYKEYLCGFEQMELITTASLLGIRESRRINCVKTLEVSAYEKRAVFDDEIGRYCYSIDQHPVNNSMEEFEKTYNDFKTSHLKKGESYGIPFYSLVPVDLDNVLVAGRCIGTDRKMHGSMRVMPGCFISGQASGCAAALCSNKGIFPTDLKIPILQKALIDFGAYLPNANVMAK